MAPETFDELPVARTFSWPETSLPTRATPNGHDDPPRLSVDPDNSAVPPLSARYVLVTCWSKLAPMSWS